MSLRDETERVFEAIKPLDPTRAVFGQYDGYRSEPESPTARRSRPLPASSSRSTTTAGPACPSSCAAARRSPRAVISYADSFATAKELQGYERLLHDAMLGDLTLFTRADGVERIWQVSARLLEHPPEPLPHARGSWGPDALDRLVAPRHWHLPDRDPARDRRGG